MNEAEAEAHIQKTPGPSSWITDGGDSRNDHERAVRRSTTVHDRPDDSRNQFQPPFCDVNLHSTFISLRLFQPATQRFKLQHIAPHPKSDVFKSPTDAGSHSRQNFKEVFSGRSMTMRCTGSMLVGILQRGYRMLCIYVVISWSSFMSRQDDLNHQRWVW